jgi:sec-independent protein translocase protein TatB
VLDFGFSELFLCFLIALIVLGPEKLPPLARRLGRWSGNAKSYMRQLTAEIEKETQVADWRQQLEDARRAIEREAINVEAGAKQLSGEGSVSGASPVSGAIPAPIVEPEVMKPDLPPPSGH